ncbi:MAG: PAS domain S-box protein [Desulfatitalea sp.]|nr:PAS domain S-box protein [Desulfatitalea sp.]
MKLSIRWALILGFLGLIWGTQIIITSSTYLSSEKVLLRHARDIMQNIADLTMVQSRNHLSLAQGAAHLTERLISSDVVGSDQRHWAALENYFLEQLAIYPHFAGIYVGMPNGDFFDVRRNAAHSPDGFRTKIISHFDNRRETRLIWRDAQNRFVTEETDAEDTYDPRQRPWFQRALAQNSIVWTDPYIFFTSQKPGITIAGPIYIQPDQLQSVVGVDIEIDELSLFIGNLRIGKNGSAFMLNDNGDVVAFPDLSQLTHEEGTQSGHLRLVRIDELDDAISQSAFEAIQWEFKTDGRLSLPAPRFARFVHQGEAYHAMFAPFADTQWPWIICVYLPESDYLGNLQANRRHNLLITIALSILATLIGLRLARGIIRPLAGLEKEALAIKQQDLSQQYDTRSAYKEIQETANSFARMKEALRDSEEKYRGIYENIQDIYYETTLDGRILEVSPSVGNVSLYTREELIGAPLEALYEDPQSREAFMQTILADGKVNDYELRLKGKADDTFYCSINATLKRDKEGKPFKVVGSLRIINDRKNAELELQRYQTQLENLVQERTHDLELSNAQLRHEIETRKAKEEELRNSEEKYRSIITNMDNGYYEMDLGGHLTFFNDPLVELLGYEREEVHGLYYRRFIPPEQAEAMKEKYAIIRRTGIPEKLYRYDIIRKDGSQKTVEASAALITDRNGEIVGFRGVVADISERLNAEQEKRRIEAQYQQIQRLEGIGTLAGGVAHDFNNLLMGIQGNVSLMLLEIPPGHPHFDKLKNIEACVTGGADLTRQLLGFARGGKYMVKPLDLNQLVLRTTGMFGRTRKEVQIIQGLEEGVWNVMADQSQIEQVLLNLCINAWQAMPDGGNIDVTTENMVLKNSAASHIGIAPGRYVKVSVTDAGVGMDAATQQRIFEPFFTTKEMGRGTGLGLASAYGIIKNHDGAIDFISREGQGTTFFFYLPTTDASPEAADAATEPPPHGSGTILLVDDEEMVLTVNQAMLEKLGYTVLPALGGREALRIFDHARPPIDLVILDMIMPDMGGGVVFDRLKERRSDIKVLLSSGYSLSEQAEEILMRGCAGFIQKPFNMDQLRMKIRDVLGK